MSVPVLVTTVHRGVFFGFADETKLGDKSISLTKCRNCLRWHESVGGFLGLASKGPSKQCRIGTEAKEVFLHDITSVTHCSDEAVAAWTNA